MSRLGVAVVGLGVGAQHARAYRATGRCDVRWLCDLDAAKADALASEVGAAQVTTRFEEVLEDPRVQAVSIATFDDAHTEQVVRALEEGKHVFAEKPLCRGLDELGAVKKAWGAHGGRLVLGCNLVLRAAPLYRWLRTQVRSGSFGRLYAFDGDYLYGRLERITHGWRRDVRDYSVMEGGGIHLLDLLLWVSGERPQRVSAMGNRICAEGTAFRHDDYRAALLQFPSGLVGRVTANFGCVHRHHHVVRAFGTGATMVYDDAGARLHRTRDPSVPAEPLSHAPLPPGKGDLIPGFVAAALGEASLSEDTRTFFDGVAVAAACDEAARTGDTTMVTYL